MNPMTKMLSVSSTVRQTSVDTLASSRHWLLTSASVCGYTEWGAQTRSHYGEIFYIFKRKTCPFSKTEHIVLLTRVLSET